LLPGSPSFLFDKFAGVLLLGDVELSNRRRKSRASALAPSPTLAD